MKVVEIIALILNIIGGINWGLVGLFDYNLVDSLFGEGSVIAKVIYVLVGISALFAITTVVKLAKKTDQ
ncbi:DUF378 domain-containing protein [Candidatus Saccharibacteria bacterium]|jgi:uncharacterized membrane protein YuzA (DUF378 family)|nr:DUF378 domain-containing protein [Candidatus Saccharibacteria bacterium]MBP9489485.1 DUF378 domain-containing protein [Candidatus Saccharibacteria bacterium]MBP9552146.1 DUF378 domain-containing protein [Candidatus Saccharibacteria bacterium]